MIDDLILLLVFFTVAACTIGGGWLIVWAVASLVDWWRARRADRLVEDARTDIRIRRGAKAAQRWGLLP